MQERDNSHDNLRRLQIPVQPVSKQDPKARIQNWNEAFLGYNLETAMIEAERCIHCPAAPCQDACPTGNDIPAALIVLEEGDVYGAAAKFRETSNLPDMCGRLCPQLQLRTGRSPARLVLTGRGAGLPGSSRGSSRRRRSH